MTHIRRTAHSLTDLYEKAEQLPEEIREFGLCVTQVLGQLYGLVSATKLMNRLEDDDDGEKLGDRDVRSNF